MSETVETTTVPFGISGQFLFNPEKFFEISRLSAELDSSSSKLQTVEEQRRRCNDTVWLISFENRCQRLKRDSRHELVSLVEKLETQKAILQAAVDNTRQAILKLEPSALETKTTVAGSLPMYPATPVRRREGNPELIARNAVIDDHPNESTKSICKLLDFHLGVPGRCTPGIPPSWVNKFGVTTFTDAYRVCSQLVHTLISKLRRKRRLP
jgi:hypothetical protein